MSDWKDRFKIEYYELKDRCEKLEILLRKYKNDELDFAPNCPCELLYAQLIYMANYLAILEERAIIEGIKL